MCERGLLTDQTTPRRCLLGGHVHYILTFLFFFAVKRPHSGPPKAVERLSNEQRSAALPQPVAVSSSGAGSGRAVGPDY